MRYARYVIASAVSVLSACSPPADPIGRGAAHFAVDDPLASDLRDAKFTCAVPGIGGIGAPGEDPTRPKPGFPPDLPTRGSTVQPVNMGRKVADGEKAGDFGSYRVECKVSGKNSFSIEIDLAGPNASEFAPSTSGEAALRLVGSVDGATGVGTGQVYVRTTETAAIRPNPEKTCSLQVLTDSNDASIYRVEPGKVDLTFVCEDNTPTTAEFSRCETRGTVTVENCLED